MGARVISSGSASSTSVDFATAPTAISSPTTLTSSALTKRYTVSEYTITVSAVDVDTETLTCNAHGLLSGDAFIPQSSKYGLTANTVYFVIGTPAANTFQISATLGGSAFNLTADTGTFTAKCSYRITLPAASGIYGAIIFEYASTMLCLGELYADSATIDKGMAGDIFQVSSDGTSWKCSVLRHVGKTLTGDGSQTAFNAMVLDSTVHGGYAFSVETGQGVGGDDAIRCTVNGDETVTNYAVALNGTYNANDVYLFATTTREADGFIHRANGGYPFMTSVGTIVSVGAATKYEWTTYRTGSTATTIASARLHSQTGKGFPTSFVFKLWRRG